MLRLFRENKPVKIRSAAENTKYGVAARDVKELLKKGCKVLQVSPRPVLLGRPARFLFLFLFLEDTVSLFFKTSKGQRCWQTQETHSCDGAVDTF